MSKNPNQGLWQKTIAAKAKVSGIGLHTGQNINLCISPAPIDSGIVFKRTDIESDKAYITADYSLVVDTQLGTVIANEYGVRLSTIEHIMAALWSCGIDNAIIEVDGAEIPILDGSSLLFIKMIEKAGVSSQAMPIRFLEVQDEIRVGEGDAFLSVEPYDGFAIEMEIDFPTKVIGRQKIFCDFSDISFRSNIAEARTFGFLHEVEALRKFGLARGGSLDNAIVIDGDKLLNEEGLRFADEFVRHKVLDCVGDLYLAGYHLKGLFRGFKSGHGLNNKLLRAIFASGQYEIYHAENHDNMNISSYSAEMQVSFSAGL